jgi:hypothetical protein
MDIDRAPWARGRVAVATLLAEAGPRATTWILHAAAVFFMGIGNRPVRALQLAAKNRAVRDTPRSRALLARARRAVAARSHVHRWAPSSDPRDRWLPGRDNSDRAPTLR